MIAIAIAATAAATTWVSVSAVLMSRCTRSLPVTPTPRIDVLQADAVRRARTRVAATAATPAAIPGPRTSPEAEPVMPALPARPAVPAPRRR